MKGRRYKRMTERQIILSPEGKKSFEAELNHLKLVKRKEIAERIKAARAFGDLVRKMLNTKMLKTSRLLLKGVFLR
jgi:hypothetical protein